MIFSAPQLNQTHTNESSKSPVSTCPDSTKSRKESRSRTTRFWERRSDARGNTPMVALLSTSLSRSEIIYEPDIFECGEWLVTINELSYRYIACDEMARRYMRNDRENSQLVATWMSHFRYPTILPFPRCSWRIAKPDSIFAERFWQSRNSTETAPRLFSLAIWSEFFLMIYDVTVWASLLQN